jgi:HK97 family phage prohead protease
MQVVSATQFKRLNRNRHVTGAAVAVRKQMIAPAEQIGGYDRCLRFTISTGCIDREQDCIAVQGWELGNYQNNPVVLWGHDAERLPIGKAFDVALEGDALKATVQFIPADTPEGGAFAESVYRLAKGGFIAATSVGFRPLKWAHSKDPSRGADDWFPGIDFEQQELIEFSVVTVPANPEALIDAPQPMPAPAMPGEVASDTPPTSGEEVTALDARWLNERDAELYRVISENQEQARARARRLHVLQLTRLTLDISNNARAFAAIR